MTTTENPIDIDPQLREFLTELTYAVGITDPEFVEENVEMLADTWIEHFITQCAEHLPDEHKHEGMNLLHDQDSLSGFLELCDSHIPSFETVCKNIATDFAEDYITRMNQKIGE